MNDAKVRILFDICNFFSIYFQFYPQISSYTHYFAAFRANMVESIEESIGINPHPLKERHHPCIIVQGISCVNTYRPTKTNRFVVSNTVANVIDTIKLKKDSGVVNSIKLI